MGGPEVEHLIGLLAKLPGMGPRSARRAALLVCAVALVAVISLGGPLLPCLAAYAAGWAPFLTLLPLQALLRVRP